MNTNSVVLLGFLSIIGYFIGDVGGSLVGLGIGFVLLLLATLL